MSELEIFKWLTSSQSPWSFVAVVIFILVTFSGLMSKAAADYGGVFGAAARALRRHRDEAIRADEVSNERRLARLEETVERLDEEVAELCVANNAHQDYAVYVAGEWHRLELWAATQGVVLPPPPLLTFPEWKVQREKQPRDQP